MAKFGFLVEFSEDSGTIQALVPSLPGCVSHGKNQVEAERNILEAIEGMIASRVMRGEEVKNDPKPNTTAHYQMGAKGQSVTRYMEFEVDTSDTEKLAKFLDPNIKQAS